MISLIDMTIAGRTVNTKTLGFFLLFFLASLFVYWIKPVPDVSEILENIAYLTAPLLACISCLVLTVRYGLTGKKSLMFFALLVGLSFLFAGESIFVYFDYFLNERPFPTIADALYLLSYPFIFIAMIIESRFMRISLTGESLRYRNVYLGMFALIAFVASYFGVYSAYSNTESLFYNLIAISYGVGDLFIIAGAMHLLFLARNLRRSAETYFWTGIIAGFGSITAADIMFARFNLLYLEGNYFAKNVMDSLWILGYVTIAFFLMNFALSIRKQSTV